MCVQLLYRVRNRDGANWYSSCTFFHSQRITMNWKQLMFGARLRLFRMLGILVSVDLSWLMGPMGRRWPVGPIVGGSFLRRDDDISPVFE